jgi:ABC-type nitrate/sulfonate/bicarbonate transport system permease component
VVEASTKTTEPAPASSSVRNQRESNHFQCVVRPGPQELDPSRYNARRQRTGLILGAGVPILLFLAWQIAASLSLIDTRFFPAPADIAVTAVGMIENGMLISDAWTTLRALLLGLSLGILAGITTGVALGLSWHVRSALEPMLQALYTVPKLAILPILLLIFGLGETPKVLLVSIGVWFILWITVLEAILDIPAGYIEAAESFGVRGWRRFTHVTFPAILPQIFVALRLAVGNAVLIVVGVEFVSGDAGIGHRIWHSWSLFAADRMYVGVVLIALLGLVLATIVRVTGRFAMPWATRNKL